MASERIEWKLAAIVEADVAGGRRRGHARAAARQTSQALACNRRFFVFEKCAAGASRLSGP